MLEPVKSQEWGEVNYLPAVLISPGRTSSISMRRALNQIKRLLENIKPESDSHYDYIAASIDDVDVMIARLDDIRQAEANLPRLKFVLNDKPVTLPGI